MNRKLTLLACLALLLPGCMTALPIIRTAVYTVGALVKVVDVLTPDKEKAVSIIHSCGYQMSLCEAGHDSWCSRCERSIVCPQCYGEQAHRDAASEIVGPDKVAEPEEVEDDGERSPPG